MSTEHLNINHHTDTLDPLDYKVISGVYFVKYTGANPSQNKPNCYSHDSFEMSITDENGDLYTGCITNPELGEKISKYLEKKGYKNESICLPTIHAGGIGKRALEIATGQAHIYHTQHSMKDRAEAIAKRRKGATIKKAA